MAFDSLRIDHESVISSPLPLKQSVVRVQRSARMLQDSRRGGSGHVSRQAAWRKRSCFWRGILEGSIRSLGG
jgi:hypothetical protein